MIGAMLRTETPMLVEDLHREGLRGLLLFLNLGVPFGVIVKRAEEEMANGRGVTATEGAALACFMTAQVQVWQLAESQGREMSEEDRQQTAMAMAQDIAAETITASLSLGETG